MTLEQDAAAIGAMVGEAAAPDRHAACARIDYGTATGIRDDGTLTVDVGGGTVVARALASVDVGASVGGQVVLATQDHVTTVLGAVGTAGNAKAFTNTVKAVEEQGAKVDKASGDAAKAQQAADAAKGAADDARRSAAQGIADAAKAQQAADGAASAAAGAASAAAGAQQSAEAAVAKADQAAQAVAGAAEEIADAKAKATEAAEAVEGLSSAVASHTASLGELVAAEAELRTSINQNAASITQVAASVTETKAATEEAAAKAQDAQDAADAAASKAEAAASQLSAAQGAASSAAQAAASAKKAADDAQARADAAHASLADAQAALDAVESKADANASAVAQAKAAVDAAQDAADIADAAAATAKQAADAAQAKADKAEADAAAAQTSADAAKAAADAAQESADLLATRVTSCETSIAQNAEAIELRATKDEVTKGFGERYTKTEADALLKVQADRIGAEVSEREALGSRVASVEVTAGGLETSVEANGTDITALKQTATELRALIKTAQDAAEALSTLIRATASGVDVGKSADGESYSTARTRVGSDGTFSILPPDSDSPMMEMGSGALHLDIGNATESQVASDYTRQDLYIGKSTNGDTPDAGVINTADDGNLRLAAPAMVQVYNKWDKSGAANAKGAYRAGLTLAPSGSTASQGDLLATDADGATAADVAVNSGSVAMLRANSLLLSPKDFSQRKTYDMASLMAFLGELSLQERYLSSGTVVLSRRGSVVTVQLAGYPSGGSLPGFSGSGNWPTYTVAQLPVGWAPKRTVRAPLLYLSGGGQAGCYFEIHGTEVADGTAGRVDVVNPQTGAVSNLHGCVTFVV